MMSSFFLLFNFVYQSLIYLSTAPTNSKVSAKNRIKVLLFRLKHVLNEKLRFGSFTKNTYPIKSPKIHHFCVCVVVFCS